MSMSGFAATSVGATVSVTVPSTFIHIMRGVTVVVKEDNSYLLHAPWRTVTDDSGSYADSVENFSYEAPWVSAFRNSSRSLDTCGVFFPDGTCSCCGARLDGAKLAIALKSLKWFTEQAKPHCFNQYAKEVVLPSLKLNGFFQISKKFPRFLLSKENRKSLIHICDMQFKEVRSYHYLNSNNGVGDCRESSFLTEEQECDSCGRFVPEEIIQKIETMNKLDKL